MANNNNDDHHRYFENEILIFIVIVLYELNQLELELCVNVMIGFLSFDNLINDSVFHYFFHSNSLVEYSDFFLNYFFFYLGNRKSNHVIT